MQSFKLQVDKQQIHCQYYHMMLDLYNFICLKSVTELKSDVHTSTLIKMQNFVTLPRQVGD